MLKINYSKNKNILSQELGYYDPILANVQKARHFFQKWVNTLPEKAGQEVYRMGCGNQRTFPGRLVGERDAFWLGEIVDASKESQLIAALGSITGYGYFLHQDDLVDGETSVLRHTEIARNFLYSKLLESFQRIIPNHVLFWDYWNKYLEEYTEGLLYENVKKKIHCTYSRDDDNLRFIAARSAPVKICASSLAISSGRFREIPQIEKGIEQLTIGLQLRDDLADCLEDFFHNNYTPVVSSLIGKKQPSQAVFKKTALYTQTIEKLLDESTWWFRRASDTLTLFEKNSLQIYIDFLSNQNEFVKNQIKYIKEDMILTKDSSNSNTCLSIQEDHYWNKIYKIIQPKLDLGY